jgi:hypothetical protein
MAGVCGVGDGLVEYIRSSAVKSPQGDAGADDLSDVLDMSDSDLPGMLGRRAVIEDRYDGLNERPKLAIYSERARHAPPIEQPKFGRNLARRPAALSRERVVAIWMKMPRCDNLGQPGLCKKICRENGYVRMWIKEAPPEEESLAVREHTGLAVACCCYLSLLLLLLLLLPTLGLLSLL